MQLGGTKLLVMAALSAIFAMGCGDLCSDACDCTGDCSDKELEECQHDLDTAEREADNAGCLDTYDDLLSCYDDVAECIGDEYKLDGCDKEAETHAKCMAD